MTPRLLVLLCVVSAPLAAQVPTEWTPDEESNANLPASIRVYETTTPGAVAWYVRADPADASWRLAAHLSPSGTETVASFASREEALVALNGGYFGGSQSFSLVLDRGQASASNIAALNRNGLIYYPTRGAFGLSPSLQPDVAWIYDVGGVQTAYSVPNANEEGQTPEPQPTASFPAGARPWDVQTAIGGGPVLVENGQVRLTWEEEVFFGGSGVDTTSSRARTAAGYDAEGRLLLLAAAENPGLTLRETAEAMIAIGAVEAVNLDGGGSTNLIAGGQALYTTTRRVASALMLVPTGPGDPVLLDTGGAGYHEEGAWFESANTPYFGPTPARLLEVGAPGRAVFSWDDLPAGAGTYQVDAWWVPAPNRATDTPYTIYSQGTPQTIRTDQSDPASSGRWNDLGTFDLAPGDSIVVTADATPGSGPTFVCVDALRLTPLSTPSTESTPRGGLGLHLAPNPARDRLTVTVPPEAPGPLLLVLLDTLGRIVREETHTGGGPLEVDVRDLAPGVYTLQAQYEEGTTTRRLTVVR